ncbi:hypothetical protein TNCV_2843791 [Trichonephila clavipes]|nr:hypothetical protein TNCV_2843791 [Trichonephila clavipes]
MFDENTAGCYKSCFSEVLFGSCNNYDQNVSKTSFDRLQLSKSRWTTANRGWLCSPRGKKEQKFYSRSDSCKPYNHYRYACFSKNHITVTKSSCFRYTEAFSLHCRHRRERLLWFKRHVGWDHQNWFRVMFSDECRFSVTSDSGPQLLWRERGTRYAQRFVNVNGEHERSVHSGYNNFQVRKDLIQLNKSFRNYIPKSGYVWENIPNG